MKTNKTVTSGIEKLFLTITPRLVAVNGPLSGETLYLDEPVVSIGRLESNDVCLEDPFVSRHHCEIRTEGDECVIQDLNSANGTYLNGERVNAASLKEGMFGSNWCFPIHLQTSKSGGIVNSRPESGSKKWCLASR